MPDKNFSFPLGPNLCASFCRQSSSEGAVFYQSSDVCVIARAGPGWWDLSLIAVGSHLSPCEIVGISPLDPTRFKRSARWEWGKKMAKGFVRVCTEMNTCALTLVLHWRYILNTFVCGLDFKRPPFQSAICFA